MAAGWGEEVEGIYVKERGGGGGGLRSSVCGGCVRNGLMYDDAMKRGYRDVLSYTQT